MDGVVDPVAQLADVARGSMPAGGWIVRCTASEMSLYAGLTGRVLPFLKVCSSRSA